MPYAGYVHSSHQNSTSLPWMFLQCRASVHMKLLLLEPPHSAPYLLSRNGMTMHIISTSNSTATIPLAPLLAEQMGLDICLNLLHGCS